MGTSLEATIADAQSGLGETLDAMLDTAMALGGRVREVSARTEAARARLDPLAAVKSIRSCRSCGWTLAWRRRDARYCSAACRSEAARARRA